MFESCLRNQKPGNKLNISKLPVFLFSPGVGGKTRKETQKAIHEA